MQISHSVRVKSGSGLDPNDMALALGPPVFDLPRNRVQPHDSILVWSGYKDSSSGLAENASLQGGRWQHREVLGRCSSRTMRQLPITTPFKARLAVRERF